MKNAFFMNRIVGGFSGCEDVDNLDFYYAFHAWRLDQNVHHLEDDILVKIIFWQKVNALWFKLHKIIYVGSIHIKSAVVQNIRPAVAYNLPVNRRVS